MSSSRFVTSSELFYVRAGLPFIMGIVFVSTFPGAIDCIVFVVVALSSLATLFALNMSYAYFDLYRRKPYIAIIISILFFVMGCAATSNGNEFLSKTHFSKKDFNYLRIMVAQEPQIKGVYLSFKAEVLSSYDKHSEANVTGHLLVSIKVDTVKPLTFKYGDELIIPNLVKETIANPNPATFNYKKWLSLQQIHHQIFLRQEDVQMLGHNTGNAVIKLALAIRAKQVLYFRKILKSSDVYAVASTLILGYRSDLSADVLGYYSKTGTIHALSVSGMHVGLIYLVLSSIFSFLNRSALARLARGIIILLLIWAFTFITGLSPSVLRSAVMISAFIIGKGINRSANGYNTLAFSAFIILLYDPMLLWDIGFQLSYLAVLGLIFLQPILEHWFFFKNKVLRKAWSALSISMAAQLFTFPISIYYFHQFPLYFLISNLFILLPVTAIMYLGILVLILRLDFLAGPLEWLISFTNSGLRHLSELPFASLNSIWINKFELLVLSAAIISLLISLQSYRKYLLMISLSLYLLLQTSTGLEKYSVLNQRTLLIYNIRKHYAIAFISANEAVILTELQTNEKLFKQNILPYLEQQRVTKIICTTDLNSIERSYLKIVDDDIQFYDLSISKINLMNLQLASHEALIKKID